MSTKSTVQTPETILRDARKKKYRENVCERPEKNVEKIHRSDGRKRKF